MYSMKEGFVSSTWSTLFLSLVREDMCKEACAWNQHTLNRGSEMLLCMTVEFKNKVIPWC
jgi:hypothetical protein